MENQESGEAEEAATRDTVSCYLTDEDDRYLWIDAPELLGLDIDPLDLIGERVWDVIPEGWIRTYRVAHEASKEDKKPRMFMTKHVTDVGKLIVINLFPLGEKMLALSSPVPATRAGLMQNALLINGVAANHPIFGIF